MMKVLSDFQHRAYVPDVAEVKKEILEEAHRSMFFIHPGNSKMYQDLKWNFFVAGYEERCG